MQHQVKLYEDKQALVAGNNGMNLITPLLEIISQQHKTKKDAFLAGI